MTQAYSDPKRENDAHALPNVEVLRKPEPVYKALASAIQARRNCQASQNTEWLANWAARIEDVARNILPSGSGIDSGTKVDLEKSTGDKIVLVTSFHHMDESGCYDGWTEHVITARPSFVHDLDLAISGRNRNDIKEYLHEVYDWSLRTLVSWDEDKEGYRIVKNELETEAN